MANMLYTLIPTILLVTVYGQGDIVLIEGPQDRAVLSGQYAELTCHIDPIASGASHVVQWLGNSLRTGTGKQLTVNDRVTFTDIPDKFSVSTEKPYNLGLQSTDLNDAGKYSCNNVQNGQPIGDLEPQLVVLKPAACPMPGTVTFKHNDTITYEWSVKYAGERDDSQKPTITWTLNGIEQTATADENTPEVYKSNFTKAASSVDNQKELNCSFTVLNVQQHCSARLNIQYPARKPALFVDGNNLPDQGIYQRTIGDNVELRGESLGNPAPVYTWQFKGKNDDNFGNVENGDTKQINNIQFDQAGTYKCCASNNLNGYGECSELTIDVVEGGNPGAVSGLDQTTTIIIIVVAVAVVVIIVVIIVVVLLLKKRKAKDNADAEKAHEVEDTGHTNVIGMDNLKKDQDPRNKNVEGLIYADLALDDTPRSRKPIQLSSDSNTEYAEIRPGRS